MSSIALLATFAMVHLLVAASPGPNLVLVSSCATLQSRRHGLYAGFGIALGAFTWAVAATLGLGAALAYYPSLYVVLQSAGALYLIWLGLKMLRNALVSRHTIPDVSKDFSSSARGAVAKGYIVTLTNPKSLAYWTSLFAVLIPPTAPPWVLAAAVVVGTLVSILWWSVVAFAFSTGRVRGLADRLRRHVDAVVGLVLVGLGFKLLAGR